MSDNKYQEPYPVKERLPDHHRMVLTGCLVREAGNGTLPVLQRTVEDEPPSGHHRNRR